MRVEVYRNLHRKCFSVRALEGPNKGRVIARAKTVAIDDPKFVVRPAGRDKVRAEGKKNVHAFVRGTLRYHTERQAPERMRLANDGWENATYNPYENDTFVNVGSGAPVLEADVAVLCMKTGLHFHV